jgi:hypothetical protein
VDFVLRFCEEGLEGKERSSKNAYAQAAARPGMHRPQNQRNAGKSARLARVSARERPTLRVFVSSPADVRPERLLAERVVQRLDREFSHHLRLETVMWEHEPLLVAHHFQYAAPRDRHRRRHSVVAARPSPSATTSFPARCP